MFAVQRGQGEESMRSIIGGREHEIHYRGQGA